jgi:PAS domain S-box-containing protein
MKILLVEDIEADYLLIKRHIDKGGIDAEICWMTGGDRLESVLLQDPWDLILTDYNLPGIDFPQWLATIRRHLPDVPLILVSGSVGEEKAVELLKMGLNDFVLKDRLFRLVPAIERSLSEAAERKLRKAAELKSAQNEQLMRAVLDGTPDAIFVKDCRGRYIFCNEAAARFVGRPMEDVIGHDDTFLFAAGTAGRIMRNDREVIGRKTLGSQEEWLTTREGERYNFLITKGPLVDRQGEVYGIFGISRDNTAHKIAEESLRESEVRFRTYVENSPIAIIVADGRGRFLDANPAALQILGYEREALLSMGLPDVVPADESALEGFKEALQHAGRRIQGEFRMVRQDGKMIWGDAYGIRIGDNRFLAYFQDITERKNIEKEQKLNLRLLDLVHNQTDVNVLLQQFTHEIKLYSGCQAVGIRMLDDQGNIPYHAYEGFDQDFYESESPLSIHSDACMCISVIKGETDSSLPYYTEGGSFYMNGTTRFLATVSEQERGKTRNVCNTRGFESVALIPFKNEGKVIGLIHVADAREDMVPLSLVLVLEQTVMQLGIALQRAQSRLQLRESEERFRAIIDNARSVISVKDLQGGFLLVNTFFLSLLGKSREEVIGRTDFDLLPRNIAEEQSRNDRRVIESGIPIELEEAFLMADGYHTFLSIKFPLVDRQGKAYALCAVSTDVTRLKRAEFSLMEERKKYQDLSMEYRVLLDNVPDGIVYLSPDCTVRWANARAQEILQVKGDSGLDQKKCFSLFWNRETPCPDCPAARCIISGKNENGEYSSLEDGRKFEIRSVPIIKDAGEVEGVIEILRDITAHRKLEEQFRQAQKMESIGTLAGGIAHDFNNILSAILGYGELTIDDMAPDDPHRDNLNTIIEAGMQASRLTKDLLLFSRKQVSDKHPVDLNAIIVNIEKFIRRIIGEDIQCETHLARNPMMIFADGHQIEQVLMNFVTNSRDAMPGGGQFTLATEFVELDRDFVDTHGFGSPGPYALLTVSDTGKGMDKQTVEKIFEPFFTTKSMGKGTGLGLAVVYGIIREHQGHINVYSEPGKGTVIRVYLPVIKESGRVSPASAERDTPQGGTETILLAEDETTVRRLFTTLLKRYGYTVIEAVNGEDAIAKFRQNRAAIDLLLFDLVMPKLNGKKAMDAIRQEKSGIKGIFISGYAPENIQQKDLLDSRTEMILKPVSPKDLLQTIRRTLDAPAEEDQAG